MTSTCQKASSRSKTKTMTGSKVNDIGSLHLHTKHIVTIENLDSGFSRASVKDQLFIDKLLLGGLLSLEQHAYAESLIEIAQKAGVYLKSPSMAGVRTFGGKPADLYSSGLMRWSRIVKRVLHLHGEEGEKVLHDHIIGDMHTSDPNRIDLIRRILSKKESSPKGANGGRSEQQTPP